MKLKAILVLLVLICTAELFPQKVGDAYALDINYIYLPMNRSGVLAHVNIPPLGSGGQFGGNTFLFSGGFFLSGYSNGQLWANAVASASLLQDYLPGTYQFGPNDPDAQLYKISYDDPPFGQSWQHWNDAVVRGADFYDGDGDGIYNPIDLNSNGQWDPNEDRPDLLGDETLWCVYHDAVPSNIRRWNTVEPQGIEIRQTVFAYSTVSELRNTIFIRYRIKNTGVVANEMTDVYFGVWGDPDIGDYTDDLVGCDTLLQSGYTYNDGADAQYGNNPPAFFERFLSGPVVYIPDETFIDINGNGVYDEGIDTPLDTASVNRRQFIGVKEFPGAKNQALSSSVQYIQSHPAIGDPASAFEARNYMLGRDKSGNLLDPCNWVFGLVRGGVNCSLVNPLFWYSGDPIANYGWINIYPADQRQMQNVGPFKLKAGEEYEVFVSYNVGQGTSALNSISEGRAIARISGVLYDFNFEPGSVVSFEDQKPDLQPNEYILHQNYPNPFNPVTKFSYGLPSVSMVDLKIYNVLGQLITTLVNEEKPAGFYEVDFNAAYLPSGVYMYRIQAVPNGRQAGDYVQTRKMMLIK